MERTDQTLLDLLGLDDLSLGQQERVLADMGSLIFEGTLVRLIGRMNEGTRAELDALMDGDVSAEDLIAFLREKVPGSDEAVSETVQELRDDILAVSGPAPA